MAIVNYGLSEKGFKRKRLPECIQSLNDRVSDKLGIQIQTGANSVFGQIHGVYGYELSDLWAQAEEIYQAMYPSTAYGDSLSNAAGLAGIALIAAEKTTIIATCYGEEGAQIPYNAQISDRNYTYSCTYVYEKISADRASYIALTFDGDPVTGRVYSLTIDGTVHTYTAVAGNSKATVLISLYNQFSFDDRTGNIVNDTLVIVMNDESETMSVRFSNLSAQTIGSPFNFACDTPGAVSPEIGKITQIPLTYAGWTSVSNNVPAAVGRDAETDIALRQRWSNSVFARSMAMVDSIAAAVYQNVEGVTVCMVLENDTDNTDADGRPPHSIECIVAGGAKADIAKQIWLKKAPGISTYGSQSADVTDSQGIIHTMRFNRPAEIKIWMKVIIMENPEEELPGAGPAEIQSAIVEKGASQRIGEDVVLQKYFAAVFAATKGVGYINLTACAGNTEGTYSASNIVISPRQVAVFDKSRITVTVQA